MGLLQRQVSFKASQPPIEIITEKLRDITGLEIEFEHVSAWEEGGEIFCEEIRQSFYLDISTKGDNCICYLLTTDLGASYLLDSTVFVLISLGGTWLYTLPSWAGLPWITAKEQY